MIVSNDSIMKTPYEITNAILKLIASISEKIGAVNAHLMDRPSPKLRKQNRVKTIKASLEIEGNTLSESQITAIIENKRVIGPPKDIQEVTNAIKVYDKLSELNPESIESFLHAHKLLMQGLVGQPDQLRTKAVGIFKGKQVSHIAPPADRLDFLMSQLFEYLKQSDDPVLLKSCVVHYEIEFIHPFMDGNGRMGRLWQTLILMQSYPLFEYLPFETIIKNKQDEYYAALEQSDKEGKSTKFITFILEAIDGSLSELLNTQNTLNTAEDRLNYFVATFQGTYFSRKDYQKVFKDISTATASRDLKFGVDNLLIEKEGDKRNTKYRGI